MTRPFGYYLDPKYVRDTLRRANSAADNLRSYEAALLSIIREIDINRLFVRYGYKSLRTYIIRDLKLTRTQAQRLVTLARRNSTTVNIGKMGYGKAIIFGENGDSAVSDETNLPVGNQSIYSE